MRRERLPMSLYSNRTPLRLLYREYNQKALNKRSSNKLQLFNNLLGLLTMLCVHAVKYCEQCLLTLQSSMNGCKECNKRTIDSMTCPCSSGSMSTTTSSKGSLLMPSSPFTASTFGGEIVNSNPSRRRVSTKIPFCNHFKSIIVI